MSVKQRLIEFIKFKNISIREFCRTIGVSQTYVTSMRSSIQPDKLVSINVHFPELNSIWLLTGEGEMIKENSDIISIDRQLLVNAGAEVFKDKLIDMFKKGEIYSSYVIKEKDDMIRELFHKIAHLEDKIEDLKRQLAEAQNSK